MSQNTTHAVLSFLLFHIRVLRYMYMLICAFLISVFVILLIFSDIVDRSEMSKTRKRAHMLKKKVLQAGTSLGTSKPDKDRGGCHHRRHHHHHRHCHPCRQKYSKELSPPFNSYQAFLNYLLNNGHRPQESTR